MAERVSQFFGKSNCLLVCPHGYDDTYTDIMTEAAATTANCNAVINRGWERDSKVDVIASKANCNNIKHVEHDVVKDEFLDPIVSTYKRLVRKHGHVYVFHVHGCGNDVRTKTGANLDLIIGYGKGEQGKSRPTCDRSARDLFTWLVENNGWLPAQAGEGSRFSGWDKENLLQWWRLNTSDVDALQLEFVTATRKTKSEAKKSGEHLGKMIKVFLDNQKNKTRVPSTYSYLTIKI